MPNYCRELNTDIQVDRFVDGVLNIHDKQKKRKAINKIASAERNIKDYSKHPTSTHQDNRDFRYRDEDRRSELRKQIVTELFGQKRLENDDKIRLGRGGAAPISDVKFETTQQ